MNVDPPATPWTPTSAPPTPGAYGGYTRPGTSNWVKAKNRAIQAGEYYRGTSYMKPKSRPGTPGTPRGAGLDAWKANNPNWKANAAAAVKAWHAAPTVGYILTKPKSRLVAVKAGFTPKRAGIPVPLSAIRTKVYRGKVVRRSLIPGAL